MFSGVLTEELHYRFQGGEDKSKPDFFDQAICIEMSFYANAPILIFFDPMIVEN